MSKKIFSILILLVTPGLVLAQNATSLPAYINNVFTWSIRIGGLVAFGALVYGGIKYLTSRSNSEAIKTATSYMTGALIGLVLLLGSYLILNTINPDLVNPRSDWKLPSRGVCFYEGGKENHYCTTNSEKKPNFGTSTIEPTTLEFRSSYEQLRGIYLFPQQNWEGGHTFEANKGTGTEVSVSDPQSFFLDWNTAGVYLYKETGQEVAFPDKPYQDYQSNSESLGSYIDQVKSVGFRNHGCNEDKSTPVPEIGYAAVLHSETDFEGQCSVGGLRDSLTSAPGSGLGAGYCAPRKIDDLSDRKIEYKSASITAFNYSFLGKEEGEVTFYDRIDHHGDHFTISASRIADYYQKDFEYPIGTSTEGITVKEGDDPRDNEKMENIHSIQIRGDFLVALGRDKDFVDEGEYEEDKDFGPYCEVIRSNASDLSEGYIAGHPDGSRINSIGIIPYK